ncbi:MAG: FHA domain-containing protein [Planctomycetaceae bacterium]|nr:FHA domain-containing protein [Planctomycetaceae bacterium]
MSSTLHTDQEVATLRVIAAGRQLQQRVLREGDRLVLGADEAADVVLTGEDVAPTHCLLTAESGVVRVRDCYSVSGTRVNGHTVREMELSRDAQIQIDQFEIQLKLKSPAAGGSLTALTAPSPEQRPDREQRAAEPEPAAVAESIAAVGIELESPQECSADATASEPVACPTPVSAASSEPDVDLTSDESVMTQLHRIQLDLIQARTENRILHEQLQEAQQAGDAPLQDPFQDEMVELLRAEVIDLQHALAAQQDVPPGQVDGEPHESVSAEEAERLVARLEELLAELQERDEQVATLTELLEATENSQDAEQAERSQINDWLAEIENRFSQKEVEWESQKNQLQQQLEQAVADRDHAEQLSQAENADARLQATQEVLAGLRETAEKLQAQLHDSQTEVSRLQQEAASRGGELNREERIQMAEEKAEIARQRQELEAARHLTRTRENNDSALKLKALREHLNEIHEKEQKEQEERRLSSRLSRLWKRLEGR